MDTSDDTIVSEIRTEPHTTSLLIATWDVEPLTDGSDGEYVLTLDNSIVDAIQANTGYMDVNRISGGEPLAVFDGPLTVLFRGSVTA